MSDYYGAATLEDWLTEEVFSQHPANIVPAEVVELFEQWREGIEANIESWMDSADRNSGHPLSWRDWGRGYSSIPQEESNKFDAMIIKAKQIMREQP